MALHVVPDVQVVQQRAPFRVIVEDRVRESHETAITFGNDRARVQPREWFREPFTPHGQALGENVTVEECI